MQLTNRSESVAVLKAIEAQHGLLVERADELWSFSHLTFQEYFTVQWLTRLSAKKLSKKIVNQQWQERIFQLVRSQQPANRLLKLIKRAIDQSIAQELKVQKFLNWVFQKSKSTQANHKPAAIRALYYAFALDCDLASNLARASSFVLALELDLDLARAHTLAHDRARALAVAPAYDHSLDLDLDLARAHAHTYGHALELNLALDHTLDLADNHARALAHALDHALALAHALDHALALTLACDPDLKSKLQQLRVALPAPNNWKSFHQWWQANGSQWAKQLCQVMIKHRNMGHDWHLKKRQLERYYNANKFLVDLMKIEGAVSEDVRAEIEDTLLLPWAELQRRQPEIYRDLK